MPMMPTPLARRALLGAALLTAAALWIALWFVR